MFGFRKRRQEHTALQNDVRRLEARSAIVYGQTLALYIVISQLISELNDDQRERVLATLKTTLAHPPNERPEWFTIEKLKQLYADSYSAVVMSIVESVESSLSSKSK